MISAWAARVLIVAVLAAGARTVAAQSVVVDGPVGQTLPTITPSLTLRAFGFGSARPLRISLRIGTSADFTSGVIVDSTFTADDSVVVIQVTRPLPSDAVVFWQARVQAPGITADSPIIGPRSVPTWLTLIAPNSPAGDIFDVRRPRFIWRSARVTPAAGPWRYDLEVILQGRTERTEQSAGPLADTTWTLALDLQANASYRWRLRASLPSGGSYVANSSGSFIVKESPLPASTLVYQNFPNPFPTAFAFATCIWFDVAEPGARLSMSVTDLRGNLVRTLIPGADGLRDFAPGAYGRGLPGAGSSCDNRFVWDGTGDDGRTVAAGVYLLRFQSGLRAPVFKRMLFRGR